MRRNARAGATLLALVFFTLAVTVEACGQRASEPRAIYSAA